MVFVDDGVAQVVIFIAKLQYRRSHLGPFRHAQALCQGTGGNVAHDDLQRHDLHMLYQRIAVV